MHQSINDSDYLNDIGLLILDQDVTLNEKIQISCLRPSSSNTFPGINLDTYIVGWGRILKIMNHYLLMSHFCGYFLIIESAFTCSISFSSDFNLRFHEQSKYNF